MTAQPDLWSQRIHAYAERKPMGRQLQAVYEAMAIEHYGWWTLEGLKTWCLTHSIGISEAGVSARIRDLRKLEYGKHIIDRRTTSQKGIFEYRLVL